MDIQQILQDSWWYLKQYLIFDGDDDDGDNIEKKGVRW